MTPPVPGLRELARGRRATPLTCAGRSASRRPPGACCSPASCRSGSAPAWRTGYLHLRTRIEETAGPKESALHSLMFAEPGVPVLLGLFCEVNAGVLATAADAVAAHSATAYWDQTYAEPRRQVMPVEQHVHSLLEVSPIIATFLLTALYPGARRQTRLVA